ncbi:MAG: histidine kinase [Actinomycetota bacterium]|nr:histidine kinase [Actinomycetota bacterium]
MSLTIAGAALLLAWLNRASLHREIWFFVVDLSDAVIYGLVAYVLLQRVRHAVAWLVALTAIGGAVAALGMQWLTFQQEHPDLPQLALLSSAIGWAWVPGTLSLIVVVPWLVRDDRVPRFGRVAIAAGVALIALLVVEQLTDPWPYPDGDPWVPFGIRSEAWGTFILDSYPVLLTAVIVLGLLAAGDAYRRWRTLPPSRRRGLGWLTIGAVLLSVSFVPVAAINSFGAEMNVLFTPLTHLASQAFFPGAILVVVLGQRLWGIDLAVSRTLVWSLLTASVVAAYVLLVTVATRVLSIQDDVLQVVAAAVVAAGCQPAKIWIQRRVDVLVHGVGREPMRLVRDVGGGLDRVDPGDLLDEVVESIRSSLRLRRATIVVGDEGRRAATSAGDDGPDAPGRTIPLVLHQRDIGHLEVEPRPGERLDGRTLELLDGLAPLVAATVQLSETTTALSDSRRRLAVARDSDRRRLRRELHDGLGPALAGTALALRAGGNLMASDPAKVTMLVDRSADELDRLVEQVRAMARGLLPPTLDEDGLVPALRELAEVHSSSGIDITLRASVEPVLFAEDATAVYAVVSEAVRNVVRHSGARCCRIELDTRRRGGVDELVVRVVDDGVGLDAAAVPGVGLTSMREWAGELGGEVTVDAATPSGTVVTIVVPWSDRAREQTRIPAAEQPA